LLVSQGGKRKGREMEERDEPRKNRRCPAF
jgi:hypothetical protein